MLVRARHFRTGQAIDVACAGGVIESITPTAEAPTSLPVDHQAGWVAPALFDLQINGCDGQSFNSPQLTLDHVRHIVAVCRRHGIGALCPTLVTGDRAAL